MPLANGLYYHFHDGGKNFPPVILFPGLGCDHQFWPAEIRRLPGVRTYALDLPGHGRSPGTGRQAVGDYVASVADFMDAVGLWRAVFVGHFMGGALALMLALELPERTAGLGLISCGARLSIPFGILDHAASPQTASFAVQKIHDLACSEHTSERLAEEHLHRLAGIRPSLLYSDLLACDRFNVSGRLASVQTPALVVCGNEDKFTPVHYSTHLAANIPGAALQTVDKAGHLVLQEHPKRLAKILTVFLTTVPYVPGV